MDKKLIESILKKATSTGAEFAEVFYEKNISKILSYTDGRVEDINTNILDGVGIRIASKDNIAYAVTSNLSEENIDKLTKKLILRFNSKKNIDKINLKEINKSSWDNNMATITSIEKKKLCKDIYDKLIKIDKRIVNIEIKLIEVDRKTQIGNTLNRLVYDYHTFNRLFITVVVKEKEKSARNTKSYALSDSVDIFNIKAINDDLKEIVDVAIKKLYASDCPGGMMPVVIENGFGAVIFHESCGHALEATDVVKNISVLSNKLGEKIASEKVTLIDDGTIPNKFGTTTYDDEGNKTQKNILIENGVLKSYLVDYLNSSKMNHPITGSARRESYKYAPISRMNNTYLAPGKDKIEDMIKSIKYGLYAKTLGGGQVNTITGDFNFSVSEAYLIRDGKISEMVKGASLIGNTKDILNEVEMVSDNLALGEGICGHLSGWVRVTIGQPTIKIANILVGGSKI